MKKKVDFFVELDGNRLFLVIPGTKAVQVRIDITAVWHLFKEINNFTKPV